MSLDGSHFHKLKSSSPFSVFIQSLQSSHWSRRPWKLPRTPIISAYLTDHLHFPFYCYCCKGKQKCFKVPWSLDCLTSYLCCECITGIQLLFPCFVWINNHLLLQALDALQRFGLFHPTPSKLRWKLSITFLPLPFLFQASRIKV